MVTAWPTPSEIEAAARTASPPEACNMAAAFRERANGTMLDDAWRLLEQVFQIHLQAGNATEPFTPMLIMGGSRSMLPSDLGAEDTAALKLLLDAVTDPEMQARLGDVLWVARRDAAAARVAVRAYLASGSRLEDPDMWPPAMERYERAARLARALGKGDPLLAEALAHVEGRLIALDGEDPLFLSARCLQLLNEFRFGDSAVQAGLALKAAGRHRAGSDFDTARTYYDLAAHLLRRAATADRDQDARRALAETFVEQAEAEESRSNHPAAEHLWEGAIQAFRRLPEGKERLSWLHRRLNAAGKEALQAMKPVGTNVDLKGMPEAARAEVLGRGLSEAVCRLAMISPILDPHKLRLEAVEHARAHPLSAMFSSRMYDRQGRIIHKSPGLDSGAPDAQEEAIQGLILRNADLTRWLHAHGLILPAWHAVLEEHVIDEAALAEILGGSVFIPEDRMDLFAMGLAAGFRRDFVTALHLLIPQVEHALRAVLDAQGVIASRIDQDGIQEDWPLGRVLAAPELGVAITPLLVFELKSLLVEKGGSNLRNRLAHGMMPSDEFGTVPAIYFWWLVLRICLYGTPACTALIGAAEDEGGSDGAHDPDMAGG